MAAFLVLMCGVEKSRLVHLCYHIGSEVQQEIQSHQYLKSKKRHFLIACRHYLAIRIVPVLKRKTVSCEACSVARSLVFDASFTVFSSYNPISSLSRSRSHATISTISK